MLIRKEETIKKQNSADCTVWEYEYPSDGFSFAVALIKGRYPQEDSAVNTQCEEIYYVINGSGVIHSAKGDFPIEKGDLYHFEKGEKYWVEGADLSVSIINVPKWTPEQYKIVK